MKSETVQIFNSQKNNRLKEKQNPSRIAGVLWNYFVG
jgi:hypothetical protein